MDWKERVRPVELGSDEDGMVWAEDVGCDASSAGVGTPVVVESESSSDSMVESPSSSTNRTEPDLALGSRTLSGSTAFCRALALHNQERKQLDSRVQP